MDQLTKVLDLTRNDLVAAISTMLAEQAAKADRYDGLSLSLKEQIDMLERDVARARRSRSADSKLKLAGLLGMLNAYRHILGIM